MGDPYRFFDAETGGDVRLQLEREGAGFRVLRQIGYRDHHYDEPFLVPADPEHFRTDLASIPWMFAWLVPGLGSHLPAVLVHDGLVVRGGEGKTHDGPDVDRVEADRILRDGMADLGTPLIRRWLMWAGVSLATAVSALRPRAYWVAVVVGTLAIITVLGAIATLDLVDAWDVLPWMSDRSWLLELAGGAGFALVIPLVLSLLWRRLWKAGAIAGMSLAVLLHATVAVVVVYALYWIAERVVSAPEGAGPDVRHNLEQVTAAPTGDDERRR